LSPPFSGCDIAAHTLVLQASTRSTAGEQPADVASDAAGKDQDRAEVRSDVVAEDSGGNQGPNHPVLDPRFSSEDGLSVSLPA
jgi:hypothetical protein